MLERSADTLEAAARAAAGDAVAEVRTRWGEDQGQGLNMRWLEFVPCVLNSLATCAEPGVPARKHALACTPARAPLQGVCWMYRTSTGRGPGVHMGGVQTGGRACPTHELGSAA